jgi:ribonuclease BN (tRNA processing enzyme)
MKPSCFLSLGLVLPLLASGAPALAQAPGGQHTQVVLLGTGTPLPDPERAGPSTAIVVDGNAYIVDAGAGVVRRAAAARAKGVEALRPVNLRIAFITHLHSDHTLGLSDLMITPWIMGRTAPLELYGPPGTRAMARHILEAYAVDRRTRIEDLEHSNRTGWKVNVHEVRPGVAFRDTNVTVTAFRVRHGGMHAYGYRFDTPDRSVVVTGDTAPTPALAANCRPCDVLIAEAYTGASFQLISPAWQRYRKAFHISAEELGAVATQARPGLLILIHRANSGCDQADTDACREAGSEKHLLSEIQAAYAGRVVAGKDLEVY